MKHGMGQDHGIGQASAPRRPNIHLASNTVEPTKREGEILERIGYIFAATDELSEQIASLERRLGPALESRPDPLDSGKANEAITEIGSQLASIELRVRLMTESVISIENRLGL